ncbi:hypothetical protein Pint_16261 [Pistacia integerrima]|uniref:Uncharacterized protein n=1 Tax=Pistacia integerrima TaxID=434235 RepID=A0ACC0ZDC5_9ROSI|nr:hypothetical protein Pint_16261 [Pistacia integerrima]
MAKTVTPDAISILLSNPSPDSSSDLPEIVVQVLDLKLTGNRYMFNANDGKLTVRGILPSNLSSEVISGNIQNKGLIRILDYALNDIPTKFEKYLIVTKCEVVAPALEMEIKSEVKSQEVDIIGVVQSVSPTMSIRRKSNNEMVPKRDMTVADETKRTVVVSLWNDLATNVGQELLDMVDQSPVVAIKSLKVGDFQGISLSALGKSTVLINPDIPEAKKLRAWFDSEGKETSMASIGSGLSPPTKTGAWSMYSDRVTLSHITSDPLMGEEKPVYFSIRGFISLIKPDQTMWYRACKTCNKKVTDGMGSGYILVARVSDESGEAWISVFNNEAESIIGCSADEVDKLKSQVEDNSYQMKLKEVTWVPYLFRVSVTQREYNNEKRQRITARAVAPVDFAAESKFLLEELTKKASQ